MKDLLVVIVNFRTPDLTIQCLKSLEGEAALMGGAERFEVVVCDNDSGDGSLAKIEGAIGSNGWAWARAFGAAKNGGFSYGNNRGIEEASRGYDTARHVLLLNSDTIVHAGCLKHCVELMDREKTVGAMSCRLLNADGSVQNVSRRFPTPLRLLVNATGLTWKLPSLFGWSEVDDPNWDRDRVARDVDWLGGAFLLVRGELMKELRGLDEDFFFYGEDIEFSYRVWKRGYRCFYEPTTTTTHLGGSSSDPTRMAKVHRSTHHWRGRYIVQRKCYGRLAEWFVRGVDVGAYALKAAWHRVRGGARGEKYVQYREILRVIGGNLWRAA